MIEEECVMKQLIRCFGLLVLLSVAGVGLAQDTEFSPPTPVCEPTFEDGIFPGDGSFIFNQTVNGDSGMPYYEGPFAIRNSCKYGVGYYGFDYLGWYDNDFGWRHTFFPPLGQREVEGIPCPSAAKLYICAWDVDQSDCVPAHPNQPDFCERDLVFGDGVALTPDRLDGSNYNWNVTEFTVPLELLADGVLDVWVNIDAYSAACNWATIIHQSQLRVEFDYNLPPGQPLLFSPCTTPDLPLCVHIVGPEPVDPDGDAVTYSFRWFVSNDETGHQFIEVPTLHDSCVAGSLHQAGDTWRVIVTATDPCGLVSEENSLDIPIVLDCNPEPPPSGWDFGDLDPACYQTGTHLTGGPANAIHDPNVAWLGTLVSADGTAPKIIDQDDGDDGVVFVDSALGWWPCQTVCVDITVSIGQGYEGQPLYLYGWKDGNLDCDFSDVLCEEEGDDPRGAPECFLPGVVATPGLNHFCFADPGVLHEGVHDGIFRFRLMSAYMSCDSALFVIDDVLGETEDYILQDLQLAVELISFDAEQDGHAVLLTWATASEQNSDHFLIERKNGEGWDRLSANVRSAGTSSTRRNYQWRDESVTAGIVYEYRLIAVDVLGTARVVSTAGVSVSEFGAGEVESYRLYDSYPNPFNPTTTIAFDLKEASHVTLQVFDVIGREVAVLVDGRREAGHYQVVFDAGDLPTGLYVYRLKAGDFTATKKTILLK